MIESEFAKYCDKQQKLSHISMTLIFQDRKRKKEKTNFFLFLSPARSARLLCFKLPHLPLVHGKLSLFLKQPLFPRPPSSLAFSPISAPILTNWVWINFILFIFNSYSYELTEPVWWFYLFLLKKSFVVGWLEMSSMWYEWHVKYWFCKALEFRFKESWEDGVGV